MSLPAQGSLCPPMQGRPGNKASSEVTKDRIQSLLQVGGKVGGSALPKYSNLPPQIFGQMQNDVGHHRNLLEVTGLTPTTCLGNPPSTTANWLQMNRRDTAIIQYEHWTSCCVLSLFFLGFLHSTQTFHA